jgi:hypothetical protein
MMERRILIKRFLEAFSLAGLLLLAGCNKEKEKPAAFGNQEELWQLVREQQKIEEPIEFVYSKGTAALYRDASMGKADPNFVPKLTGG